MTTTIRNIAHTTTCIKHASNAPNAHLLCAVFLAAVCLVMAGMPGITQAQTDNPAQPVQAAGWQYTPTRVHFHERNRTTVKRLHRTTPASVEDAAADQQEQFPYVGVVTGTSVNVRSGPGTMYYRVGRLNQGDMVEVHGRRFDWLMIRPTDGAYSLVATEDIERTDSRTGQVQADSTAVRAASVDGLQYFAVQTFLNKGDTVHIIGQQGVWYRIEPPDKAYWWISGDYVQQQRSGTLDQKPEPRLPDMTTVPDDDTATTTAPASQPAMTADDYRRTLGRLEKELAEEYAKPLEQQSWQKLYDAYEELTADDVPSDVTLYATQRLEHITKQRDVQQAMRRVANMRRDLADSSRRMIEAQAQTVPPAVFDELRYSGVGILRVSMASRDAGLPNRYRLVDPAAVSETVAFVDIDPDTGIDVMDYLGKRVGVRGPKRLDTSWNSTIIQATSIRVLDGGDMTGRGSDDMVTDEPVFEPNQPASVE